MLFGWFLGNKKPPKSIPLGVLVWKDFSMLASGFGISFFFWYLIGVLFFLVLFVIQPIGKVEEDPTRASQAEVRPSIFPRGRNTRRSGSKRKVLGPDQDSPTTGAWIEGFSILKKTTNFNTPTGGCCEVISFFSFCWSILVYLWLWFWFIFPFTKPFFFGYPVFLTRSHLGLSKRLFFPKGTPSKHPFRTFSNSLQQFFALTCQLYRLNSLEAGPASLCPKRSDEATKDFELGISGGSGRPLAADVATWTEAGDFARKWRETETKKGIEGTKKCTFALFCFLGDFF